MCESMGGGGSVRRRIQVSDERGVAMTEFALILPVFMAIVVGLLSFGRIFFYWIETNHLASETARWAVVDRNPYAPGETLPEHARNSATVEFKNNVKVCIDHPGTVAIGQPVKVRVQTPFTVLPLLSVGTVMIRGSSTMRIERFANGTAPTAYTAGAPFGACT